MLRSFMIMCGRWLDADDPWQTLAACMELRNALESPNPLEYLSRLPIHQVCFVEKILFVFNQLMIM